MAYICNILGPIIYLDYQMIKCQLVPSVERVPIFFKVQRLQQYKVPRIDWVNRKIDVV